MSLGFYMCVCVGKILVSFGEHKYQFSASMHKSWYKSFIRIFVNFSFAFLICMFSKKNRTPRVNVLCNFNFFQLIISLNY